MPSSTVLIVCEWRLRSIPFLFQSHPESGPWNRSEPLCQPAKARRVAPATTLRFPHTSKTGRSLHEVRGSLHAACPRHAYDPQYPYPQHTNELSGPAHRRSDCSESRTIDTGRRSAALESRFPTALFPRIPYASSHAVSPSLPHERLAHGSRIPSVRSLSSRHIRGRSDSRTRHVRPPPRPLSSEELHQPSVVAAPPRS